MIISEFAIFKKCQIWQCKIWLVLCDDTNGNTSFSFYVLQFLFLVDKDVINIRWWAIIKEDDLTLWCMFKNCLINFNI